MRNYHWFPTGAKHHSKPLEPGMLVAFQHAVWRVISVTPRPRDLWDDTDLKAMRLYGDKAAPLVVVLRPAHISDNDLRARDHDKHYRTWPYVNSWNVYPDEHYPICASCGEPTPCREKIGKRIAEDALRRMGSYENPGVCPACKEPVTSRQKWLTFSENLELPGGPPVTFHVGRRGCRYEAADYEKRWVAADPNRRRTTLSCSGHVTNHNDGTYDCTQLNECPSPEAFHPSYTTCSCPDCHARGRFTCHPKPTARRNGASETKGLFDA